MLGETSQPLGLGSLVAALFAQLCDLGSKAKHTNSSCNGQKTFFTLSVTTLHYLLLRESDHRNRALAELKVPVQARTSHADKRVKVEDDAGRPLVAACETRRVALFLANVPHLLKQPLSLLSGYLIPSGHDAGTQESSKRIEEGCGGFAWAVVETANRLEEEQMC